MIEKIYIDKEVKDLDRTKEIVSRFSGIDTEIIDVDKYNLNKKSQVGIVEESKKQILLTRNYGKFIKKCPGTKSHLCCNYYVITPVYNCPLDCSYCFLQGHINSPFIKIFVNDDEVFKEMDEILKKYPDYEFRFGTGEFSDSLVFEEITDFSKRFIEYIKGKPNVIFEMKTKIGLSNDFFDNSRGLVAADFSPRRKRRLKPATTIENIIIERNPVSNVVLAWSVNPERIITIEEKGTATLDERIEAARKCQEYGYKIAFHFDPIILSETWERDYKDLINYIFSKIKTEGIAWISLGALRYTLETQDVIRKRFPESLITYNEMIQGLDGKYRYFKKLREMMFMKVLSYLKEVDKDLLIYMCMEGDFMWKKIYGGVPDCTNVKTLFV